MPMTLGIDPTARAVLGWATVADGGLLGFGDVPMSHSEDQSELGMLKFQGDSVARLIEEQRPAYVAIERPITNSRAAVRYLNLAAESGDGASLTGRLTGAVSHSIDVGLAVGVLIRVCQDRGVPIILINPGAAKFFACGSVTAKKRLVQEAARLRVYELAYQQALQSGGTMPQLHTVKRPSEHTAAAIFIGLRGEHEWRTQAMLSAA